MGALLIYLFIWVLIDGFTPMLCLIHVFRYFPADWNDDMVSRYRLSWSP